MRVGPCTATLLLLLLGGCPNLDEYATGPGEVFSGSILGTASAGCDRAPCSFVRRGFPEGLQLEMTFDPREAGANPGVLTSSMSTCGQFFRDDPLLPITPLAHDDLSLYEFPGARLRNYIFGVRPSAGPLQGRDITAFVSLIDTGAIEVRLLAGAGHRVCAPDDCDAFERGECDAFGIFSLTPPDS